MRFKEAYEEGEVLRKGEAALLLGSHFTAIKII
ncbi:hypothetical protein SAMN05421754_102813 [Nitrosomonas sp. Nm58]|nr:hypothetical protein SAMN05421754_102813 [Nitrosomonas sp. Nm58]